MERGWIARGTSAKDGIHSLGLTRTARRAARLAISSRRCSSPTTETGQHLSPGRQRLSASVISRSRSARRPTTNEILLHPYFWSNSRRLSFLQDASDSFEILERDPPDALLLALEAGASRVIGPTKDWMRAMDQNFIDSLGKYRKVRSFLSCFFPAPGPNGSSILCLSQYDVSSLRDLLRALRNKRHHFLYVCSFFLRSRTV